MARQNYSVVCSGVDAATVASRLVKRDMVILRGHDGRAFLVYCEAAKAKKWNKDFPRWPCR